MVVLPDVGKYNVVPSTPNIIHRAGWSLWQMLFRTMVMHIMIIDVAKGKCFFWFCEEDNGYDHWCWWLLMIIDYTNTTDYYDDQKWNFKTESNTSRMVCRYFKHVFVFICSPIAYFPFSLLISWNKQSCRVWLEFGTISDELRNGSAFPSLLFTTFSTFWIFCQRIRYILKIYF